MALGGVASEHTGRETGFALEAAGGTEGCEGADGVVGKPAEQNICPQAWRIVEPLLYLELELSDLSLSFV